MANKRNSQQNENLLDEPVPDIKEPVLTPQPASSYVNRMKKHVSDAKSKWNRWVNWFLDYIPPIPKVIDKAFEVVKKNILNLYKPFEITDSKSALKNYAIVYIIEGQDGYDERPFLRAVKQTVIGLLQNHYETKVKIILHCIMERYEARSGEIITAKPAFYSDRSNG